MRDGGVLRAAWIGLALVSVGILGFGVVTMLLPAGGDGLLYRADGLASFGLGGFGLLIAVVPFRRRERWAWSALWFYPVFWLAHLVFGLPPGTDHVHQVVFVVLSLAGLLLPVRQFFPGDAGP
jgi:peptidoglycan/LPS O-acetylase OafA/YrhL